MPRTALTAQTAPGAYLGDSIVADSLDLTFTAADNVDGNDVPSTGKELVIVRNDDAAAQTITFTSIKDDKSRKGDIAAYSIGIGEYAIFGPFPLDGWRQTDGKLYIDAATATIFLAVIKLP